MPIVLITADNCGMCTRFKQMQLPELKSVLDKAEIKLVHINVSEMMMVSRPYPNVKLSGPDALSKYHKVPRELFDMISYFPTILAVRKTDDGMKIVPFGGVIENGKIRPERYDGPAAAVKWYKGLKKDKSVVGVVIGSNVSTQAPQTESKPIALAPAIAPVKPTASAPAKQSASSVAPKQTVPIPEPERRVLPNGSVITVPTVYMTYTAPRGVSAAIVTMSRS